MKLSRILRYLQTSKMIFLVLSISVGIYSICVTLHMEAGDILGGAIDTIEVTALDLRSTVVDSQFLPGCQSSLNEMVIAMSKYLCPEGSATWIKNRRILSQAKIFFIMEQDNIFNDTTANIIKMLEGYGLQRFINETVDSNIVLNYDTVILQHTYSDHSSIPVGCHGSKCDKIPKIALQTEQIKDMPWAIEYVKECHESPICVLWDFSQVNFEWAQKHNFSDSFMVVPYMFHDRYSSDYPPTDNDLLPYWNRPLDVVFFGSLTRRRKIFRNRNIRNPTGILSKYNVEYKKVRDDSTQIQAYKTSKICLNIHSYSPDSGGEFHRLSDFKRFGCIPIMETFVDDIAEGVLRSCGGVIFAKIHEMPYLIDQVLHNLTVSNPDIQRKKQLAVYHWWQGKIEWDSFLEAVLGPKQQR